MKTCNHGKALGKCGRCRAAQVKRDALRVSVEKKRKRVVAKLAIIGRRKGTKQSQLEEIKGCNSE